MVTEAYLLKRIEMIQGELELLKRTFFKRDIGRVVHLKGMWQGIDLSIEEIEEAKHSLLGEELDGDPGERLRH